MTPDRLPTQRRDLLKMVGAAGAAAGAGTGAMSTAGAQTGITADDFEVGWSVPAVNFESGTLWEKYDQTIPNPEEATPPYDAEEVGSYRTKTVHSLSYVNADWEPLGNPAGSGGCWRHTFVLSSLGLEQVPEEQSGEQADEGQTEANWEISENDYTRLQDNAVSVHVPDGDDAENVAVAARRNPALFSFVDPVALRDQLVDGLEPGGLELLLEQLRQPEAESGPSTLEAYYEAVMEEAGDAEEYVESLPYTPELHLWTDLETAFGVTMDLATLHDLGAVTDVADKATLAMDLFGIAGNVVTLLTNEAPPRFDRGVSQTAPGFDGTVGAGGHYLMFDVYTAPGESATVEVSSDYFGQYEAGPYAGSWELTFPEGPEGPAAVESPADAFFAEAERDDSIDSREE